MKRGISTKLFLITTAFLMIFLSLTMYFQSAFFGKFYTNRKVERLENNVIKYNMLYTNGFISSISFDLSMLQFEENNNAKIVILNSNGAIIRTPVKIDASKINVFNKLLNEWANSPAEWEKIVASKKTITTDYYNKDFNVNNVICISPVVVNNTTTEIILVVSSLQPIEEASAIIKEFYIYIFWGAAILIIILSFIYSNMISKPLIVLNRTASKMVEMDFTTFCPVKSEDEIGNLARSLNFLSYKLDSALTELKSSNIKLQKDIDLERHLDKMRKEFIAGVSHELKTPIALISGYSEGLKDNIVDGESRDFYIDVIMDEANKMSNLVSDMLDLSQLESGNFKLKPDVFFIDDILNSVAKKHQAFMLDKGIKIVFDYYNDLEVIGDKRRIDQVITNFLTNSIRHTPVGGFIKITSKIVNNEIYTEIENEGEHIELEDLKNIWDKFYKIDKSRARNDGGTGLGLSIVKNILLLHNSNFGVKNTDAGVAFYFTLKKP